MTSVNGVGGSFMKEKAYIGTKTDLLTVHHVGNR